VQFDKALEDAKACTMANPDFAKVADRNADRIHELSDSALECTQYTCIHACMYKDTNTTQVRSIETYTIRAQGWSRKAAALYGLGDLPGSAQAYKKCLEKVRRKSFL
jgi:hypothetical protein